jgi:hypothetical protein
LGSQDFLEGMARKFGDEIRAVYNTKRAYIESHRSGRGIKVGNRMILTRDYANYSISPHTDAPPKFITALFYLAKDESMLNFGTSVYAPKDSKFKQWGADRFQDAHLPYEDFRPEGPEQLDTIDRSQLTIFFERDPFVELYEDSMGNNQARADSFYKRCRFFALA